MQMERKDGWEIYPDNKTKGPHACLCIKKREKGRSKDDGATTLGINMAFDTLYFTHYETMRLK